MAIGKTHPVQPNEPVSTITRWRLDEMILAEIGKEFSDQATRIKVRVSQALAQKALELWRRDGHGTSDNPCEIEAARDRLSRTRSGTLALIGVCIENGVTETVDGFVVVEVNAWQIGDALNAADEFGLL
jgi:hypothetical protein